MARSRDPEVLLDEARAGDRGSLGRLLSMVEGGGEKAQRVAQLTYPLSAAVELVVGITGAPGAGKSTLTNGLLAEARKEGTPVGVLAVDPSSPFTGGAILGDRVRMQDHAGDAGVFIRSMATRGHIGGLSLAVPEAIRVLAATGYPTVLVETVGVGQVEVDVAGASDSTVVVVTPGWGDEVQAAKAGLLEVGDVFVVNKADREGAERTRRDLEMMLDLDPSEDGWRPPVLLTSASRGEGMVELWGALRAHRSSLEASGELAARRERLLRAELERCLTRQLAAAARSLAGGDAYAEAEADVLARRTDPQAAARRLAGALARGN